jgi:hypothetical protein
VGHSLVALSPAQTFTAFGRVFSIYLGEVLAMAIQAVLDEEGFGGLDEPLQQLYRQNDRDKKFYLDLPSEEAGKLAFNLREEIETLRQHSDKVLGEKKSVQSKLRELEEQIQAKSKEKQEVPDFEDERKRLQASFEETLQAERAKANAIRQQVANSMKEAAISRLRAEYDLNETAEYVLDKFISVVPESEGSDSLAIRVLENGKPAYVAGDYKAPDLLVQEWREQGKHLGIFNAPKGGGTGGRNDYGAGKSGAKIMKRSTFDSMGAADKVTFMREGGTLID